MLADKIQAVKNISQTVHAIQDGMKNELSFDIIKESQTQCRELLEAYSESYGTLPIDDKDIKRFTREHPSVSGLYEALLSADDPLLVSDNVYRKHVDVLDGHNTAISALLMLRSNMEEGTPDVKS